MFGYVEIPHFLPWQSAVGLGLVYPEEQGSSVLACDGDVEYGLLVGYKLGLNGVVEGVLQCGGGLGPGLDDGRGNRGDVVSVISFVYCW